MKRFHCLFTYFTFDVVDREDQILINDICGICRLTGAHIEMPLNLELSCNDR